VKIAVGEELSPAENAGRVFEQAVADGERAERAQQGTDGAADAATVGCGGERVDIGRWRERDRRSPGGCDSVPAQQSTTGRQAAARRGTAASRSRRPPGDEACPQTGPARRRDRGTSKQDRLDAR